MYDKLTNLIKINTQLDFGVVCFHKYGYILHILFDCFNLYNW